MTTLHRRTFLAAASGVAGLAFTTSARSATRIALAQGSSSQPTVVVVFLRGGVDGLNLLVPYGDPSYRRLRPNLALGKPGAAGGALDLDGYFGLHPSAAALLPAFQAGLACGVHAVGTAANTRSHFEEQDRWETAVDGSTLETQGWLARHLASTQGRGPVRAIALGDALTRSLRGEETTLALRGLDDLVPRGSEGDLSRTLKALERAYGRKDSGDSTSRATGLLQREGQASLEALELLEDVARRPHESSVVYPDGSFGRRTRELARLIRADLGLEVASLDLQGWDTHQNQGTLQGPYAQRVREVSDALAALLADLEDRLDDLLVLVVSEFGRTAAQNGTAGTDHGHGGCVLALGGPVLRAKGDRSGPVLGEWPGLGRDELNQGRDLRATTDYRDVYAAALTFLGHEKTGQVLGGHSPKRLPICRTDRS